MAGLTSITNSLLFLLAYVVISASATNNTTQFGNFTIEWQSFSLFSCGQPASINISLFTCLPSAGYAQVQDISCLTETSINFDQTTCQSTTSVMYTSTYPVTTQKQTTAKTNTVQQTQTSAGTAGVTGTTVKTTVLSSTKMTQWTTGQLSTVGHTSATTSAPGNTVLSNTTTTIGSTVSPNSTTTTGSTVPSNSTTTPGNMVSPNTTTTSGYIVSSNTSTTTGGTTTVMTTTSSGAGVLSNTTSSTTATTTLTSTSSGSPFFCNTDYIGVNCNISADPCAMSQPCLNSATCFPNESFPFDYSCQCQPGFIGYDCELNENSCQVDTCWHNGTCVPVNSSLPSYNGTNFRCECVEGYNGLYCEYKIDLCENIMCENRGICETIQNAWKCLCLDSTFYSGDYCQFKSGALQLREMLSKSFAAVAIGAIVTTCSFVVVMDVLKYAFHIDPVEYERDSYRRRRELQRQARHPPKITGPKIAVRFQYVT